MREQGVKGTMWNIFAAPANLIATRDDNENSGYYLRSGAKPEDTKCFGACSRIHREEAFLVL
jgi:hypothetical protein